MKRESHLLEASRYVVLNPERVTAACGRYHRYRWSSYRATAGLAPAPAFLAHERILELFSHDRAQALRSYRAFVRAGVGRPDPKAERVGEIYLGDTEFARRTSVGRRLSVEVPRTQREPIRSSIEELLRARHEAALALAYREGYSLRELASVLGVHYSTVSRRLKAEEAALGLR